MAFPVKAAIYCRVSTEEQAKEGFSIAAQKKTLTSFCSMKGWETARVYCDEGLSGKNTRRPAFQELLRDAQHRQFNVVLVWKINRFSRKNSDLLNTVEYLNGFGINLVSYCEQFDSSTPSGRLMLSMLGSIGEFERDTIVENIRSGMTERASQGLFNGGRVLGYDTVGGKLVINEDEALTVKKIYGLYLSGYGYKGIQKVLINENRKTKNGCTFSINSIKRVLENPIYAGFITYNKTKKSSCRIAGCSDYLCVPGKHDSIITKDQFDKAREIASSRRQTYLRPNSFILSPILKCPFCGCKMTGHTKGKRKDNTHYRYYICLNFKNYGHARCRPAYINADIIEDKIIEYICSIVSDRTIARDICNRVMEMQKLPEIRSEARILEKELIKKRAARDRYFKLFEDSAIDGIILSRKILSINDEINTITSRINELQDIKNNGLTPSCHDKIYKALNNFKQIFKHLEFDIQKRLLVSIVKEIHLNEDKTIRDIEVNFIPKDDMRYTGHNIQSHIDSRDS